MTERVVVKTLEAIARATSQSAVGAGVIGIEAGRTKQAWLRRGPGPDTVIDMSGYGGVVEHAHGDLTVTVRAGIRLAELQAQLAERKQRLALDPPLGPERAATVGGIFATDDAGPARLDFGSLRELCIGVVTVLPDGVVARSGGRVIKNVAGYDLCKLYCGSRGTLGTVAELTLRCHPLPEEELTLRFELPPEEAARRALRLQAGRVVPSAVTVHGARLWVRLEGTAAAVDGQGARVQALLEAEGERLEGEASRAAWAEATETRRAGPGEATIAISTLPSRVPALLAELPRASADGRPARVVSDPLLGLTLLTWPAGPLEETARVVEAARAQALALGGHARLRGRPPELDAHVDPYGPLPSSIELMRAVKLRLDPVGRCMPGRYLPRM